ncbi:bifunctional 2-C-methyl-D-erythritol 4-phosphate cytidylyltransferase/2-C-methyl-D-erythritol 2,4-cyclodiphosphate synthase [Kiloniella laminariae]|uniref:Bifunctional enzyme IspD/IspF n=1 Tax=Kiloniella laminariae TaxID=454162 RepID=A0ABT4LLT2_9PROT|nr:bifunctional 2-C-methyl-D-erythritol 4-phosphate cytidylyltransferase/2-C-methyl-D-erythritol 2,4-cyclodiphosphate synthase [Kiloniella laminariae]MCZ4282069.1 bifunctional 2-C-methyl-D-erythritol 4-phosphate cytidylyltransferase/2-C-methyl-D-erythritol 2,4-cyclodiphosphate synthase [Kiloniella laminariae]
MPGIWAVIVAAGRGRRFGSPFPKQYTLLGQESILSLTLNKFSRHRLIDGILVVVHPEDIELFHQSCPDFSASVRLATGGDTRQESVFNGLKALEQDPPSSVLIHDAARPFIKADVITRLIEKAASGEASIAATPVVDSLKFSTGMIIEKNVNRDGLWQAQTPQAFPYEMILSAHRQASDRNDFTDDAAVAEYAGHPISLVESGRENIKITTPDDLILAKNMIKQTDTNGYLMESRTGLGYDVHSFEEGDHVTLCGVDVPHSRKLKGHSDADVGLHALTDALLGALCEGDIGSHFPPSDQQWKGARSDQFLIFARDRVKARGGKIIHVDVTLVCERPKIGPHREAMTEKMAEILSIPPSRVSIKATTSERLGFTGREEGIAAQAVATIQLPANEE